MKSLEFDINVQRDRENGDYTVRVTLYKGMDRMKRCISMRDPLLTEVLREVFGSED
jgi:hypothetical protein